MDDTAHKIKPFILFVDKMDKAVGHRPSEKELKGRSRLVFSYCIDKHKSLSRSARM